MDQIIRRKIFIWLIVSANLIVAFLSGFYIPSLEVIPSFILAISILNILLILNFIFLGILNKDYKPIITKRILIWFYLSITLLFAFIIGFTIPFMESNARYNMGIIMIPLLVILNYIIIERFQFFLNKTVRDDERLKKVNINDQSSQIKGLPEIEFEDKKYIFTIKSILILAIGAPILSYLIYQFFDLPFNYWLHEIVVKQTAFFLNLLYDMGVDTKYVPVGRHHWSFVIPNKGSIYFQTFCTGVQAICVFAGIIICIPHSLDKITNETIIWRKTKALIVSSLIFYIVNIIRMVIQIYLYYIGYAWEDIHYSISAASSFIAAIIILLLHKWIPEFIISIIYAGAIVDKKIKRRRKQIITEMVEDCNKVPLNLIRRILKMDKKTYVKDIIPWAKKFGYTIDGDLLIIPDDRVKNFLEMLEWEKPFETEEI
jgi:exosortase/archaeosortase family protein